MNPGSTESDLATQRAPKVEASPGVLGTDGAWWSLRMKDLCDASGLSRQVIHFYIREGLVPAGGKATRNSAFYGEIHVDRIALVRRLQTERFLPLRAIRAVLDEPGGPFTPEQREWLDELKAEATVNTDTTGGAGSTASVEVGPLLVEHGVTSDELAELAAVGFVGVVAAPGRDARIASEDAWVIALVGELRRAGLTDARGFAVKDLAIYEETIARLFERETALILTRIKTFRAADAAPLIDKVLPLLNTLLTRHHETRVRRFLEELT